MNTKSKMFKSFLGRGATLFVFTFVGQALAQGDSWETKAPTPTPRSGQAAGVIDGKLYVAFGSTSNELVVYDPVTDLWATKASPPLPRMGGIAAAVIAGELYVVGGCNFFDCRVGITNRLEKYNPGTDLWTTLAPRPTPRGKLAAAAIDGKLYVVGGFPACPPCEPQFDVLEVYDPSTDTWETKAPMPTPREGMEAAVIDGKLYVVGGFIRPMPFFSTGVLEVYDSATDTWDTTKAPMPTDRELLAVGVIDGNLYAVGGISTTFGIVDTLEEYDPATDTWVTRSPMPTARWVLGAGVIDGKLYAVGGATVAGLVGTLEVYTPLNPDFLEDFARDLAEDIEALDLELFNGPNNNANNGRRNALANRATDAANAIADGDIDGAIDSLMSLLAKIDGESPPPDWMDDSPEKTALAVDVVLLIALLLLE